MKLSKNVKVKPWFWNLIPWVSKNTAQAIYPNIYLPVHVYQNLISNKPDIRHTALLAHEQEHIRRQQVVGVVWWMIQYFINPKFRFEEELAADIPRMKIFKQRGAKFDIETRAKKLSGWLYFWPVSYQKAKTSLQLARKRLG